MNSNYKIENEIQKTIDLLEQGSALADGDQFYGKVLNKMRKKSAAKNRYIKPALMTILIIVNILSGYFIYNSYRSKEADYYKQLISKEYFIENSTYFNF